MNKVINENTIVFKSKPDIYKKEKFGLKPNTIRRQDKDERFKLLEEFESGEITALKIRIVNAIDGDYFEKWINDVTYHDGYYIISWKTD